jgi:hydrogenase nickel incorporation protein HypA/HybF
MDHMHEVAVMQNVVETLLASMEKAGASRVTNVQLALSTSGHSTEEAVHLNFQALTRDTPIEGASLRLSWLPATYQCLACKHRFESTSSTGTCPHCGEVALEISHQDGCSIRTIDVVSPDA